MTERTDNEVDAQIEKTLPALERGRSAWPGMTYEQGVDAALRWAMGYSDDPPMEEE